MLEDGPTLEAKSYCSWPQYCIHHLGLCIDCQRVTVTAWQPPTITDKEYFDGWLE